METQEKPKKMKRKDLREEIEIPKGINATLGENVLIMKKDDKELKRKLNVLVDFKIEEGKVILEVKKPSKREKKIFGTMKAHIRNMIKGLTDGFKYKLQAVNVHFPMTVEIDKNKNELLIKNFLGEKIDRVVKLKQGVEIKIDKDIIEIESTDKELAGQVAGDIEKGARVRNKDRRIYQDGIFITEKPGRVM
jgi:large subunit ribosomal protein L6